MLDYLGKASLGYSKLHFVILYFLRDPYFEFVPERRLKVKLKTRIEFLATTFEWSTFEDRLV